MSFNLSSLGKLVKIANSVQNSKQAISMLLDKFGQKNPQMANIIRQAINSGKSPKQVIMEQAQAGKITLDNLNQLKGIYGFAQKLGLAKKVPQNVWNDAETAIRNGADGKGEEIHETAEKGFNGLFNGF